MTHLFQSLSQRIKRQWQRRTEERKKGSKYGEMPSQIKQTEGFKEVETVDNLKRSSQHGKAQ